MKSLVFTVALLITGCATNNDVKIINAQITGLKQNNDEIKNELVETEASTRAAMLNLDSSAQSNNKFVETMTKIESKLNSHFRHKH